MQNPFSESKTEKQEKDAIMQKMPTDDDESSVEEWAPQHTKYTEESTVFTLADEESICFGEEETLDGGGC